MIGTPILLIFTNEKNETIAKHFTEIPNENVYINRQWWWFDNHTLFLSFSFFFLTTKWIQRISWKKNTHHFQWTVDGRVIAEKWGQLLYENKMLYKKNRVYP